MYCWYFCFLSALATGENLTVRPSKIVAGHEADKTNIWLQALGRAITQNVSMGNIILNIFYVTLYWLMCRMKFRFVRGCILCKLYFCHLLFTTVVALNISKILLTDQNILRFVFTVYIILNLSVGGLNWSRGASPQWSQARQRQEDWEKNRQV